MVSREEARVYKIKSFQSEFILFTIRVWLTSVFKAFVK